MQYLNELEYIESYDYFLIDEAFNARQMFMEMMDLMPEGYLTEAQLISLNEGVIENLKNFVITIAKRIAAAISKFIGRVEQIIGIDKKWLNDNQTNLAKGGVVAGGVFNNFHKYTNIDQVANNTIVDDCNQAILESNKEKWADEEGYISTNPTLGIPGFQYKNGGDSLKDQIQSFLRGERIDGAKSEEVLTPDVRAKYIQYCSQVFPSVATTINAEKETLKAVTDALERYIETKRSQQIAPPQPSDVTSTQTAEPVQANVNPSQPANVSAVPAAFEFTTADEFLDEVDIKNASPEPKKTNSTTTNNAGVNGKIDTKVDSEKKRNEELAQISKATRTYFKVNSAKLSAKMNVCVEAYRTRIKLLKWYLNESTKNKGENVKPVAVANNKANTGKQKMSDAFG